jgi:hypothetical protein
MQNETPAITQTEPEVQTGPKITHCLNCDTEFEGKFCPECGQSADTGRFTMKFIWENLLAAFLSKDGGVWFTLKNLFTRPGAMIVEILNGKRRRYFSPFPMLIFALTVYVLMLSLTGSRDNYREVEQEYMALEAANADKIDEQSTDTEPDYSEQAILARKLVGRCLRVYNNHYTTIFMLTLPLFLFAARVCYGKSNRRRYYRAEYLVAITYSMVMVVLYRCLVSLMYPISKDISESMGKWIPLAIIIAFTLCLRKMMGFSSTKTAWRSLLTVVLYYIMLGIIALIGIIIIGKVYVDKFM